MAKSSFGFGPVVEEASGGRAKQEPAPSVVEWRVMLVTVRKKAKFGPRVAGVIDTALSGKLKRSKTGGNVGNRNKHELRGEGRGQHTGTVHVTDAWVVKLLSKLLLGRGGGGGTTSRLGMRTISTRCLPLYL